jgi:hypothetical protein
MRRSPRQLAVVAVRVVHMGRSPKAKCKRVNLRVGCHAHNNQPDAGYFEEYVLARVAPRSWDSGRPDVFVFDGLMA